MAREGSQCGYRNQRPALRQTFFAVLLTLSLGSPLAWAQSPTAIVGSVSGPARTLTPDGHQELLQGPCLIRLGAAGGHLIKGDTRALQVKESELGEALRPPDNEATRMDVGNGNTLKLSTQAQQTVFSWQTQQAGPYLVTVTDSTRQANIWSSELAGNSVTDTGPELLPDNPTCGSCRRVRRPWGPCVLRLPRTAQPSRWDRPKPR